MKKEKATPEPDAWSGFTAFATEAAQATEAWLDQNKPPSSAPSMYDQNAAWLDYAPHKFTWDYVRRKGSPKPNTSWRDYAVEASRETVKEALGHLKSLALKGNVEGLAALAEVATSATTTLSTLAVEQPALVSKVARSSFLWPFLKARKEPFGDNHKRIVKEIELGCDAPFSEAAISRIHSDKLSVKTAMPLLCRLETYRSKNPAMERMLCDSGALPEWKDRAMRLEKFSEFSWQEWFEVGWCTLLADYNGHPENSPSLSKIGQYRANHSNSEGAQKTVTEKTRISNIRDGIKDQLRKAVKRLAKSPNKSSKK